MRALLHKQAWLSFVHVWAASCRRWLSLVSVPGIPEDSTREFLLRIEAVLPRYRDESVCGEVPTGICAAVAMSRPSVAIHTAPASTVGCPGCRTHALIAQ